jgi:hypothetical protein
LVGRFGRSGAFGCSAGFALVVSVILPAPSP